MSRCSCFYRRGKKYNIFPFILLIESNGFMVQCVCNPSYLCVGKSDIRYANLIKMKFDELRGCSINERAHKSLARLDSPRSLWKNRIFFPLLFSVVEIFTIAPAAMLCLWYFQFTIPLLALRVRRNGTITTNLGVCFIVKIRSSPINDFECISHTHWPMAEEKSAF